MGRMGADPSFVDFGAAETRDRADGAQAEAPSPTSVRSPARPLTLAPCARCPRCTRGLSVGGLRTRRSESPWPRIPSR